MTRKTREQFDSDKAFDKYLRRLGYAATARAKYPADYWVWRGVKQRCYNPKHPWYARYGGRGIRMCDEWRNSFQAFARDMGPRPSPKHTIERIDNDGDYRPGNCRWGTMTDQNRNKGGVKLTQSHVKAIKHLLRTTSMTPRKIAAMFGVNYATVYNIRDGSIWSDVE